MEDPMSEQQAPYGNQVYANLKPHSVEMSRNSKGEVSISVKVYGETEWEAGDKALMEFRRLKGLLGLA